MYKLILIYEIFYLLIDFLTEMLRKQIHFE